MMRVPSNRIQRSRARKGVEDLGAAHVRQESTLLTNAATDLSLPT